MDGKEAGCIYGIIKLMVKVSVIVPIYNTGRYLRRCLDSIMNQSLKDIEILLIDNNSTDDSPSILKEYVRRFGDSRKIVSLKCRKQGASAARNLGIRRAVGEYLTFCDSDDWLDRDFCKKLYECAGGGTDLIVGGSDCIDESTGEKWYIPPLKGLSRNKKKDFILSGSVTKLLVKRELILNNRIWFKEGVIFEDVAPAVAFGALANKLVAVNEPLYHVWSNTSSTSRDIASRCQHIRDWLLVADDLWDTFMRIGVFEEYRQEFLFVYYDMTLFNAGRNYIVESKYWHYLAEIVDKMHERFPDWSKNRYVRKYGGKRKRIFCYLCYHKMFRLISVLLKMGVLK